MSSIAEQVHDNGAFGDGLIHVEQVLAWNPAILFCFFPRGTILSNADDDIQAVVTEVESLAVTLGAIADKGESIVLEIFL